MNVDAVIQVGIEREMVSYTGESWVAHTLVRTIEGLFIVQCHRITLCMHPATHKTVETAQAPWNPDHVVRADLLLQERG